MWIVFYRSTGTVAFRSTSKAFAKDWMADNDTCPETGKCLGLYALKKEKK